MPRTLKAKELEAILNEVGTQLEPVLKSEVEKAAERLAKAHPGESTSAEVPKDASATKEPSDDKASAPPPKTDGPPAPDKSASPPADVPPPAPPADAPPAAPPADPAAGGDDGMECDPAQLQAAFSAMPLETLQMYYLAAKAALIAAMGNDGGADAPPAMDAPPAAPPAPPAAPPVAPPPAMKGELPADPKANGEDPNKAVAKSEKDVEIETLKKQVADQNEAVLKLTGAFKTFVERPVRKSIVGLSDLKQPGVAPVVDVSKLTKDEARARLRKVVEKTSLSKSDRERINAFYLGHAELDSVKDLLV